MTGCWVTTMDRAKRLNQTLPCFQALESSGWRTYIVTILIISVVVVDFMQLSDLVGYHSASEGL